MSKENFPKKPVRGGIPANDNNEISIMNPINGCLYPIPLKAEISSSSLLIAMLIVSRAIVENPYPTKKINRLAREEWEVDSNANKA